MTVQLDVEYALLLSGRLPRFAVKATRPIYKMNFRCPYCLDSEKSKTKARGWLVQGTDGLFFKCFNCNAPVGSFYNFLRDQDPTLFKEYVAKRFVSDTRHTGYMGSSAKQDFFSNVEKPKFTATPLKRLKKISQLASDHRARAYVDSRKIPTEKHFQIYWAPKFAEWVNEFIPDKLSEKGPSEGRLILPFIDEKGQMFGASCRSLDPESNLRYMSIMFDESMPKLFGLNTVDWRKQYYILEGAIDSLFLSNALATSDASGNYSTLKNMSNAVFVFDNERRNAQVHASMRRVISAGYKICIWPSSLKSKDVNNMVLDGVQNVEALISSNVFSGLEAELKLSDWRLAN